MFIFFFHFSLLYLNTDKRGTFSPRSETVIQRDELQIVCGLMQIKSKEASQFTYIYVCIKKKQIGVKQNQMQKIHILAKLLLIKLIIKKTINQEYFTSKSNGHFWL